MKEGREAWGRECKLICEAVARRAGLDPGAAHPRRGCPPLPESRSPAGFPARNQSSAQGCVPGPEVAPGMGWCGQVTAAPGWEIR